MLQHYGLRYCYWNDLALKGGASKIQILESTGIYNKYLTFLYCYYRF